MSGKVADALLQTGALDELMTVDVYTKTTPGVLNSIIDGTKDLGKEAAGLLKNTPGLAKQTAALLKTENGKISLDTGALTDRLISLGSGMRGPMSKMLGTTKTGALSTLSKLGLDPDTAQGLIIAVGSATSSVNVEDLQSATDIASILQAVTGNPDVAKLLDLHAEMALFSGIVNEAVRLGIPDAFDVLSEIMSSDEVVTYVLQDNIMTALSTSDFSMLDRIIAKLGVGGILAQQPDAAKTLLTFYRIPTKGVIPGIPALYTQLTAMLTKLKVGWDVYMRNGIETSSLAAFTYASTEAKRVLAHNTAYADELLMAPSFPLQNIMAIASNNYPLAAFSSKG